MINFSRKNDSKQVTCSVEGEAPSEPSTGRKWLRRSVALQSVRGYNPVLSLLMIAGFAVADSNDAARVLKSIQNPVDEILQIHGEYDSLPKSRFFQRDQKVADAELLELHKAVLESLQISGLTELSEEYSDLQARIKKTNRHIVSLNEKKLTAPEEDDLLGLKTTKDDLDKKIGNAQEYIADVRAEQDKLVEKMQAMFEANGLQISPTQARLFLSLSEMGGDGYLNLCSLFFNVKALSRQLAEQIRAGEANPDVLKRYYGIYVVLNDAMLLGYQNTLDTIETVYLVRIDELSSRMQQTRKESEQLLRRADLSESQRAVLNGNLEAQGHFIEVCSKVREYMQLSHKRLTAELDRLHVDGQVSKNTYKTAWVGAELLDTFEQFESHFSELQNLTIDPVIPLNDPAILKQFDDLTSKLLTD